MHVCARACLQAFVLVRIHSCLRDAAVMDIKNRTQLELNQGRERSLLHITCSNDEVV